MYALWPTDGCPFNSLAITTTLLFGLLNTFIGLFKDTTLVLIVGLFDLLGIVQFHFTDASWATPETHITGYVFAGAVFWAFCFAMSRYSIFMENRLSTGR